MSDTWSTMWVSSFIRLKCFELKFKNKTESEYEKYVQRIS